MIYNAEGDFLKPILPHHGNIPKAVIEHFKSDMFFIETENGKMTSSMLIEIVDIIDE